MKQYVFVCVCVRCFTKPALWRDITWKRSIGRPKNWKMTLDGSKVGLLARTMGSEMKATVPFNGQLLMNT